jgi:hypothetical protein
MTDQSPEGDVPAETLGGDDLLEIRSELVAFFAQPGLTPDCFLSAEFIRFEEQDPTVDHDFAKYVLRLAKSNPALTEARSDMIRDLVRLIARDARPSELHANCAQITEVVLAMLTKLGIWSFGVMGSTDMRVGDRSTPLSFKLNPNDNEAPGHHWVVVPPFVLVDLTIAHQSNVGPELQRMLPKLVLSMDSEAPSSAELVPPNEQQEVPYDMPSLHLLWKWLPRRMARSGQVQILYQPHDIQLPASSLDGETGEFKVGGREARSWFQDVFLVESDPASGSR